MKHLPLAVSLSKNQYNNKIEVYYQTDEHFFFVMASDLASFFISICSCVLEFLGFLLFCNKELTISIFAEMETLLRHYEILIYNLF